MLKRKTCLLLGAGASSELGFPLGEGLKHEVVKAVDKSLEPLSKSEFPEKIKLLSDFRNMLGFGNWKSPDAFLEKHREFIEVGKEFICGVLAEKEAISDLLHSNTWYNKLVHSIHNDDPHQIKDNRLSIVTFNYDRSIDCRLHRYIQYHFGLDSETAWELLTESIPIVHLHGTLGDYPKWGYGSKSDIRERSQEIKIVSEIEGIPKQFETASNLLNDAERVVVIGFGFGEDNVQRLKFFRECEEEERDLVIFAGGVNGAVHEKSRAEWMKRWGLKRMSHYGDFQATWGLNQWMNPFE